MIEPINHAQLGVLTLLAYGAMKIVDQTAALVWRKLFGTKYVTETECLAQRDNCDTSQTVTRLEKEVRELKLIIVRHLLSKNELNRDQKKDLEKMLVSHG